MHDIFGVLLDLIPHLVASVFGASFSRIEAKAYYPTNTSKAVGGGVLNNVRIPPSSHNTLYFPFNIECVQRTFVSKEIVPDSPDVAFTATRSNWTPTV